MLKIVSSVSYPSTSIPGRSRSAYLSTPIVDPTPSKIIKALQEHFNSLQYHIKHGDLSGMKIKVTVGS